MQQHAVIQRAVRGVNALPWLAVGTMTTSARRIPRAVSSCCQRQSCGKSLPFTARHHVARHECDVTTTGMPSGRPAACDGMFRCRRSAPQSCAIATSAPATSLTAAASAAIQSSGNPVQASDTLRNERHSACCAASGLGPQTASRHAMPAAPNSPPDQHRSARHRPPRQSSSARAVVASQRALRLQFRQRRRALVLHVAESVESSEVVLVRALPSAVVRLTP